MPMLFIRKEQQSANFLPLSSRTKTRQSDIVSDWKLIIVSAMSKLSLSDPEKITQRVIDKKFFNPH